MSGRRQKRTPRCQKRVKSAKRPYSNDFAQADSRGLEFTSQLFFDEALTDQVHAQSVGVTV